MFILENVLCRIAHLISQGDEQMVESYSFLLNEHKSQLKEAARKIEKFLNLKENSCFVEKEDGYKIGFYKPITDLESLKLRRTDCAEKEDIFNYAKKLEEINLKGGVYYYPSSGGRVGGIYFPSHLSLSYILERLTTEIAMNTLKTGKSQPS